MDGEALLRQAREEKNPEKKYALLKKAEQQGAEGLALEMEWLLLGDPSSYPPGDPRRLPCHPLHSLQHPDRYPEEEQQQMACSLFRHPRLEKCLALSPDPNSFLRDYLFCLSEQYITVFLQGDRSQIPLTLWAFMPRRAARRLALAMGDVIRNIFLCPFLTEDEQSLLAGCFYRACHGHLNGRTEHLDAALGAEICALIL